MIVKWFLFETKAGLWLLTFLERKAGVAVVSAEWLGEQPGGLPAVPGQAQ